MIRLTSVHKEYPRSGVALRDVSFQLRKGELVFLTGHSGAGKSTILKLVQMAERPSSGEVRVSGFSSSTIRTREIPQLRRRLGVVFQDFRLLRDRTAEENVAFALEVTGAKRSSIAPRVNRLLAQVGLAAKARAFPDELSGGERQRVAVARALASRPEIIFADEPTGNLDSRAGAEILDFMRRAVADFGQTIVMVTHDPVAAGYADRALFLNDGRIVDEMHDPTAERVLDRLKAFGE